MEALANEVDGPGSREIHAGVSYRNRLVHRGPAPLTSATRTQSPRMRGRDVMKRLLG